MFSTNMIGKPARSSKTHGTTTRSSGNTAFVPPAIEPKFSTGVTTTVKPSTDASATFIVDSREPETIRDLLPDAVPILLEYGDYVFFTELLSVGIERKTVSDLLGSIGNGRLDRQVAGICEAYDVPILLIQGYILPGKNGKVLVKEGRSWRESGWNYDAVMNRLMTFQEYGVRLATCPDSIEWTVARLKSLHAYYSHGDHNLKPRTEVPIGKSNYSASELALSQIPGIGLDRAKKLHKHFGSLFQVVNATEEQLRFVPGVGPKIAHELYGTIRSTDIKAKFSGTIGFTPQD